MASLRELGELEVLRRLAAARRPPTGTVVDSGDDSAVLRGESGRDLVVTTDALIEGRHFLPDWFSPEAVGERLAVANLSDIAAMGAQPRWALLSMGVRPEHDADALVALQRGLAAALARDGAGLVGGNVAGVEGSEWFSLTLIGDSVEGAVWTRRGARPGDHLALSGHPGRAGAGARLARSLGPAAKAAEWRPLLDAWIAPTSRVALAQALGREGGVRAAIDVSDGLGAALELLCQASGVGALIEDDAWPEDAPLELAALGLGMPLSALRLGPSDDYELLLAIEPAARETCRAVAAAAGAPLAFIGRLTDTPGALMLRDARGADRPLEAPGYDQFAGGG